MKQDEDEEEPEAPPNVPRLAADMEEGEIDWEEKEGWHGIETISQGLYTYVHTDARNEGVSVYRKRPVLCSGSFSSQCGVWNI